MPNKFYSEVYFSDFKFFNEPETSESEALALSPPAWKSAEEIEIYDIFISE